MSIRPLRLGISGAALALIAFGAWFIATDQQAEITHRAFAARDESLLAARATKNHMSVEEMRRVAGSACVPKRPLDARSSNEEIASHPSIEECMTSYLYGDDVMYEPTVDLFEQWLFAILKILFMSAGAGFAVAALWVSGLWGFRTWWPWLRGN